MIEGRRRVDPFILRRIGRFPSDVNRLPGGDVPNDEFAAFVGGVKRLAVVGYFKRAKQTAVRKIGVGA